MSTAPLTGPLQRLMDELKKLPGVGARSAERIAFHLLKAARDDALGLAHAITAIKDEIRPCAASTSPTGSCATSVPTRAATRARSSSSSSPRTW